MTIDWVVKEVNSSFPGKKEPGGATNAARRRDKNVAQQKTPDFFMIQRFILHATRMNNCIFCFTANLFATRCNTYNRYAAPAQTTIIETFAALL